MKFQYVNIEEGEFEVFTTMQIGIAFFCATTSCVPVSAYPPIRLIGVITQKTQEFVYLI
jgi:hypothetical protein